MKTYTREEAIKKSTEYFNGDELAAEVFVSKYALKNEKMEIVESSPEQMHRRLSKEFARIEKKYPNPMSEEEIFNLFDRFKYVVPQGSPMFGIGNQNQVSSLSNCFVIDVVDSYGGICRADERIAQVSKRRGGIGIDISPIRPKGLPTKNSALTTDGIVVFMERFSNTSREVAQCIAQGQKVLTENGLKNIEDVVVNVDRVWTKVGWVKVIGKMQNEKQTYKLTTNSGYEIRTSLDHIFLTYDGINLCEKRLSEIEEGDTVSLLCGTKCTNKIPLVSLQQYEYKNSNNKPNNCILPKILDEDLAYFLGYSYGDGCVEKNKYGEPRILSLACGHKYPEIQKKIEEIIERVFKYKPHSRMGGGEVNKLDISNKCIVDFLKKNELLKEKTQNIVFPELILQSPDYVISSFISGYFDADGYASGRKKGYVFTSINLDFLKSVQTVLMSMGIISKINFEDRSKFGWHTLYTLSIVGAYSKKCFKNNMPQSIKVKLLEHNGKRDNWLTPYRAKDLGVSHNKYSFIPDDTQNVSAFAYEQLPKKDIPEGMLIQDIVASITEDTIDVTYDLQLEHEHLFWCEGFYVHNSGRRGALMISISVHHPEVLNFIKAKRDLKKVTGANISVRISDEFMRAVHKGSKYEQRWPVDSKNPTIKKDVDAKEIWDELVKSNWSSGEPGILFWDTIIKNSPSDSYVSDSMATTSTNPCITGDTLVYVADGRGNVSIKQLTEEGKDVPVFCYDNEGKVAVRTMRHPRITGYNENIYKITLDDGYVIRCTGNHKIRLIDGTYKEAKDLVGGDSLKILTKNEHPMPSNINNKNSAKIAAQQCGFENIDCDPRLVKTLNEIKNQNYECKIENNQIIVKKVCEGCHNDFWIEHNSREVSYCSMACVNKNNMEIQHIRKSMTEKSEIYNHRVVSVELDGQENVYNGTVDDFHNFFIGGFEGASKTHKYRKWLYINNLNCGELPLSPGSSCILLLQNLSSYVKNPFSDKPELDKELLKINTRKAQRLIDDMVDLEIEAISKIIEKVKNDPESDSVKFNELSLWNEIKETCIKARRTGLGVTGFGDCIAMLNIKYGSKESLEITDTIFSIIRDEAYRSSIEMAKERGAFSIWNHNKEKDSQFLNRLPKNIREDMEKHGRRNISCLTVPPAGSVSTLTQTSSGFEPVYMAEYVRKRKLTESDNDKPDFIDKLGDKWKNYKVEHKGLKDFKKITGKELKDSPYYGAQAEEIDYEARVKMQGIATSYVDHAISSTINLPNNIDVKVVGDLYMMAHKEGCKGLTVYRDGSRDGVLTKEASKNTRECDDCDEASKKLKELVQAGHRPTKIILSPAPKRQPVMTCEIHRSKVGKGDWLFFIGMLNGQPYEVFGGNSNKFTIPHKYKEGWIQKNGKNKQGITQYNLILGSLEDKNEKLEFKDINKHFNNKEYGAFTRLVSLSMRHGTPIKYICEQITKTGCAGDMFSFQRAMSRILKKYIADGEKSLTECPICKSTDVYYKNGCPTCKVCGNSNCS